LETKNKQSLEDFYNFFERTGKTGVYFHGFTITITIIRGAEWIMAIMKV